MSHRRLAAVGWHLAGAVFDHLRGREDALAYTAQWSRRLLELLGVRVTGDPVAIAPGSLVVANHVSWLDAIVLAASAPAERPLTLVAKDEVRAWPVLGWLLAASGVHFVRRSGGRGLLESNKRIGSLLDHGAAVAVFPEGTTTDGRTLLPFRAALFEPAVAAGRPVQPIALEYRHADGRRCDAVPYIGEQSLAESIRRIASQDGIRAVLKPAQPFETAGLCRRRAARLARAAIQERLGWGEGCNPRARATTGAWTSHRLSQTATLK